MRWFTGPIQDAIASAKHDQKIFLVVVEGKDETSKTLMERITDEDISGPVDENCVSIKLETDSESFRQFSQIYPVIVVPSMFFIGNNGIPLEVIAGSENKDDLVSKIQKAIELHKTKQAEAASSSTATASSAAAAAAADPSPAPTVPETASVQQSLAESSPVSDPSAVSDDQEKVASAGIDEAEEAEAQALLRQKVERAEQLMAERRKIREKEEKEAEKEKEIEQRRVSREMQKAREQLKEKEMADWARQRQREKQEDKAARQRVLAQIAQDKADRAAKMQSSSSTPPEQVSEPSPSSVRQRSPQESASNNQVVRIQFRLPNSVTSNQEFSSGSTLLDVIRHVEQVIKPGMSNFSLATSFPRRHFTNVDFSRTLRELDLCPSAVLLILPCSAASPVQHSSNGGLLALVWTLLSPLTLVWNFIYSFVFGNRNNEPLPSSAPQAGPSQPNPEPPKNK